MCGRQGIDTVSCVLGLRDDRFLSWKVAQPRFRDFVVKDSLFSVL